MAIFKRFSLFSHTHKKYCELRHQMSLFVGQLPNRAEIYRRDIEDLFVRYGPLASLDIKKSFAFIAYEDELDARDALCLNGVLFKGNRLVVEWAKLSKSSARYRKDISRGRTPHRDESRSPSNGGRSTDYLATSPTSSPSPSYRGHSPVCSASTSYGGHYPDYATTPSYHPTSPTYSPSSPDYASRSTGPENIVRVNNLFPGVSTEQLTELISQSVRPAPGIEPVSKVTISSDPTVAWIEFKDPEYATKCLKEVQELDIFGRKMFFSPYAPINEEASDEVAKTVIFSFSSYSQLINALHTNRVLMEELSSTRTSGSVPKCKDFTLALSLKGKPSEMSNCVSELEQKLQAHTTSSYYY